MSENTWQKESCGPGREYMLASQLQVRFGAKEKEAILKSIKESIREHVVAEPAVRLTLDGEKTNAERAILAIPAKLDMERLLDNVSLVILETLLGYYYNADPKSSHFGLSNLILEGQKQSLIRREVEKLFVQFQTRPDMAARLLDGVELVTQAKVPKEGRNFLSSRLAEGLDIHLGFRIIALGTNMNRAQMFIPIDGGQGVIGQIYFNLEEMIHHQLVSYDEAGQKYLDVSDILIFRELEEILKRCKDKANTRAKIFRHIQFLDEKGQTVEAGGDRLYDLLNHETGEDKQTAKVISEKLYDAWIVKSADKAKMEHDRGLPELDDAEPIEVETKKGAKVPPGKAVKAAPKEEPKAEVEPKAKAPAKKAKAKEEVEEKAPAK